MKMMMMIEIKKDWRLKNYNQNNKHKINDIKINDIKIMMVRNKKATIIETAPNIFMKNI